MVQKYWNVWQVFHVAYLSNGVTNLNFKVVCEVEGSPRTYALKRYEARTTPYMIKFEHAFMNHVQRKSNGMTTVPITNRCGMTYVRLADDDKEYYWALFSFLPGKDKYTWIFNDVSDTAVYSSGEALAKFHYWGYDFAPPQCGGKTTALERLNEMLDEMENRICELEKAERHRKFTTYFLQNKDFLYEQIAICKEKYHVYETMLPECFIHQDINPGNMMFDENDAVCAIFDLDWVAKGKRLYDVAWMGHQMLASWKEEILGHIDFNKLAMYIQSYNKTSEVNADVLGKLTEAEIEFYPYMTLITELTVVRDFVDLVYTNRDNNDIQYYFYLYRYICIIQNTLQNMDTMRETVRLAS
jgi:Ser/Thr protein kinase RdoA (MazF antagonist)